MKRFAIILAAVAAALLQSCSGAGSANEALRKAGTCVEEHPERALALLDSLKIIITNRYFFF